MNRRFGNRNFVERRHLIFDEPIVPGKSDADVPSGNPLTGQKFPRRIGGTVENFAFQELDLALSADPAPAAGSGKRETSPR
jgi:hypothetical protein